jgi:biopolymer transport protein ExbB
MGRLSSYIFVPVFVVSVIVSWYIWNNSPEYIKQGGPLLVLGLTCFFLVLTFSIERGVVLWRAGGRGNMSAFLRGVKNSVASGDLGAGIDLCKRQGGSVANVIGAGLETYRVLRGSMTDRKELMAETRRSIEEAGSLETPNLERNLSALSTIASIATLLGLLGTTIGMIRSFRAMSRAGAPDAAQLALGISEALVNTALGLITAIIGIVLYNYFTARVDSIGSTMEESSYGVLQALRDRKEG